MISAGGVPSIQKLLWVRLKSVRDHKTASECRLLMILDWQVKPEWVDVRWMYAPLYNQ